ncbi:MAG: SDR family oxidoreductase [bacterium]|nr:SDR family oxidoreductase [Gemmatimonadota bacterium]
MAEFRGFGGAALVTGATSGIGLELARLLAARGMHLILVARSAENLRILANKLAQSHRIRAVSVPMDLSRPDAAARLVEALRGIDLTVDLLVNNAAFGTYGPFADQGAAREAEMIRLNVSLPTELTALFLPGMIRRKRGVVLNVASTAGFAPVPWMGTYAATKAYLISWTHSLATELAGTGVQVAALCPGSTATNFHAVSGAAGRRPRTGPQQTASQVAEECLRGLDRKQRIIVTGGVNRLHAHLFRVLPPSWASRLADVFQRPGAARVGATGETSVRAT